MVCSWTSEEGYDPFGEPWNERRRPRRVPPPLKQLQATGDNVEQRTRLLEQGAVAAASPAAAAVVCWRTGSSGGALCTQRLAMGNAQGPHARCRGRSCGQFTERT